MNWERNQAKQSKHSKYLFLSILSLSKKDGESASSLFLGFPLVVPYILLVPYAIPIPNNTRTRTRTCTWIGAYIL